MRTPLCDDLGIEFPIFAFTHCRDVVAAVSKAGGMGVLDAVGFSPEQLEIELDWIDENIDGKPHHVIKLASPYTVDVALYIDKKTKLVSRMTYSVGGNAETNDFTDYKDVGGIKIAHKRKSTGAGKGGGVTDLELKTVEIDPKVDPAVFDKPAAPTK